MWSSSNPVLTNEQAIQEHFGNISGAREDVTTITGIVNKTALLCGIALFTGGLGYALVRKIPALGLISCLAALGIGIGLIFVLRGDPARARWFGPIYAAVEGFFLGTRTLTIDRMLEAQGIEMAVGAGTQAFVITVAVTLTMLGLYKARIVRPSRALYSTLMVATMGIMATYVLSFLLSFVGIQLPFVTLDSALQGGTAGWIGLGINLLILGVASFWLVIDFGQAEAMVEQGAPKSMEWYCATGLIVTLAWIYFEALKLVFRLAILLNSRE